MRPVRATTRSWPWPRPTATSWWSRPTGAWRPGSGRRTARSSGRTGCSTGSWTERTIPLGRGAIVAGAVGEWSYYLLGSGIELALLAAVVYVAWTWPTTAPR